MTDNTNDSDREFAYGGNVVDGCECPAVAAGRDPVESRSLVGNVVTEYDILMSDKCRTWNSEAGIVEEQDAKKVWLEMADGLEYAEEARVAYEIARDLGWK